MKQLLPQTQYTTPQITLGSDLYSLIIYPVRRVVFMGKVWPALNKTFRVAINFRYFRYG